MLLGAGAAVAARDHSSRCPLHYAGGSVAVTQLLLDFGADPEAQVTQACGTVGCMYRQSGFVFFKAHFRPPCSAVQYGAVQCGAVQCSAVWA